MEGHITEPKERVVTLTMTESEARTLNKFLDGRAFFTDIAGLRSVLNGLGLDR